MSEMSILVMGIGNLLWADEGFGIRAVEAFNARFACPDHVTVMDGGTQGLYLLPHVQSCNVLILFDAVDYGLIPGSLKIITDTGVPAFMGAKKMSLHQTGFQEVLASAELLGWSPDRLVLIGVQPESIEDFGGSLSPVVDAVIGKALDVAVDELVSLGVSVELRDRVEPGELGPRALKRQSYEAERPTETEACRIGDIRFLQRAEAV